MDNEKIKDLQGQINYYSDLYYNDTKSDNGRPPITDAEFDALEAELVEMTGLLPDQVGPAPSAGTETVRHVRPMKSLGKVHDTNDLKEWISKQDEEILCWPKYDGVSLSLHYEDGILLRGVTRGDGEIGEDITRAARRISNIPHTLSDSFSGEVRGEVVLHKDDWEELNKEAIEAGTRIFANPRNAVSGSLRLLDADEVGRRRLRFYAFDLVNESPSELEPLGFVTGPLVVSSDVDVLIAAVRDLESSRANFPYEIDGAVLRIANPEAYESAGETSHHPRGAIAYKFAAEIVETELLEVVWQVGRTGLLTPRGRVQPIFVAGATIEFASLHNLEVIAERDIRLGARVYLRRSGDVIPQVLGAAEKGGEIIEIPAECPVCGGSVVREGPLLRCVETITCPAQLRRRIEQWVSRPAADIDFLGEKLLQRLVDADLVNNVSDLYDLSEDKLIAVEGLAERGIARLLSSIDNSKGVGLRRALIGLSIPLASEGTAKRLCKAGYQNIEEVMAANPDELAQIEDIGPKVAESLHTTLNTDTMKSEIELLRSRGVIMDTLDEDKPYEAEGPLLGKTVVLTGALSVSRKEFAALLEKSGARISSSVSAKTDYVVCGEAAGSKRKKAESLGVSILDEDQARALIS